MPKGGTGSGFRARTGLSDLTANEGQTNTYLALMSALGEDVEDKRRGPQTFRTEAEKEPVDTIFFLTDGEPNRGRRKDTRGILAGLAELDPGGKVRIHTISIGEDPKALMAAIAADRGGRHVHVPAKK